jgi:hypothetical protein
MSRTEEGLYQALEEELKRSDEPLSCIELFDRASIREHAASANRVSDYLGNLWRKGVVTRVAAPTGTNTRARWLYAWKGRKITKPDASEGVHFEDKRLILQRPTIEISEAGSAITIEMQHLVITIKSR